MKGIVLAGGTGSRLYPMTRVISKHLLPVFDKPMVFYPLSTLLLAGIRDIAIISTPADLPQYQRLLGDGHPWGIQLTYLAQPKALGIAQALIVAKDFIDGEPVALILGDNVFYGQGLSGFLQSCAAKPVGAVVLAHHMKDPRAYAVPVFDVKGALVDVEEKPKNPKSTFAIPGLYFYDGTAVAAAERLRPSPRGELEITDLNREYLRRGALRLAKLGRGAAWFDAGTPDALLEASQFIRTIEHRQGLKIGCLEEVAFRMGFIDAASLQKLAKEILNDDYRQYLLDLLGESGTAPTFTQGTRVA